MDIDTDMIADQYDTYLDDSKGYKYVGKLMEVLHYIHLLANTLTFLCKANLIPLLILM